MCSHRAVSPVGHQSVIVEPVGYHRKKQAKIVAGVTFSSLFDAATLRQPRFPPYDWANTTMCLSMNWDNLKYLSDAVGYSLQQKALQQPLLRRGSTWYHDTVSRNFTTPECESVAEYWSRLTEAHVRPLSNVRRPILCLMADDDPLCPPPTVKHVIETARKSESIFVLRTQRGGHCGWYGTWIHSCRRTDVWHAGCAGLLGSMRGRGPTTSRLSFSRLPSRTPKIRIETQHPTSPPPRPARAEGTMGDRIECT